MAGVWALLRYRFLDLLPVARDALIESMSDGVAVIDAQGRVVDLNADGPGDGGAAGERRRG